MGKVQQGKMTLSPVAIHDHTQPRGVANGKLQSATLSGLIAGLTLRLRSIRQDCNGLRKVGKCDCKTGDLVGRSCAYRHCGLCKQIGANPKNHTKSKIFLPKIFLLRSQWVATASQATKEPGKRICCASGRKYADLVRHHRLGSTTPASKAC